MRHACKRWKDRGGLVFGLRRGEGVAAASGFTFFFCLFCGYFMLRPIRETLGIQAGVENLQWLFTATFVAMLIALPLFGWLNAKVARGSFVTWVYGLFGLSMLAFGLVLHIRPDSVWASRAFYVWLSVFNLFAISVGWSLMADVFRTDQAKRVFAVIAAGASVGGLVGPLAGGLLAGVFDAPGLILLAAALLVLTLPLKSALLRWRTHYGAGATEVCAGGAPPGLRNDLAKPLGGSAFAGVSRVLRSPYLLGIAGFVVLLATVSTFLYMEQARVVAETFTSRVDRIRVFSALDFTVQALSMLSQLFLTGRLATRWGMRCLLAAVPLAVSAGFLLLAAAPTFAVLATVMVLRRVGEYALVKPGREILFTLVDPEAKYKAKNFIDTVVYRAGDAASSWLKAGVDALGLGVGLAAMVGTAVALAWGLLGFLLGRYADAQAAKDPASA